MYVKLRVSFWGNNKVHFAEIFLLMTQEANSLRKDQEKELIISIFRVTGTCRMPAANCQVKVIIWET